MFNLLTETIDNSLDTLTTILNEHTKPKIHPLDSDIKSGSEGFIILSDVSNSSVEIPSGDPNQNYGIGTSVAAISNKLNNVPYCPISVLGKNDRDGFVYNAKLSGAIEDVVDYLDLLECLAAMKENDEIIITIDSPGGYVHTGVLICTHILMCRGHVRTHAVGLCASAGSLIWSAGHTCTVEPTALLMWHMSSHMDCGNSLAIQSEAILQVHFVRTVLLAASEKKGHITREEIERICTDPNVAIYITAEEMTKRLVNTPKESGE